MGLQLDFGATWPTASNVPAPGGTGEEHDRAPVVYNWEGRPILAGATRSPAVSARAVRVSFELPQPAHRHHHLPHHPTPHPAGDIGAKTPSPDRRYAASHLRARRPLSPPPPPGASPPPSPGAAGEQSARHWFDPGATARHKEHEELTLFEWMKRNPGIEATGCAARNPAAARSFVPFAALGCRFFLAFISSQPPSHEVLGRAIVQWVVAVQPATGATELGLVLMPASAVPCMPRLITTLCVGPFRIVARMHALAGSPTCDAS